MLNKKIKLIRLLTGTAAFAAGIILQRTMNTNVYTAVFAAAYLILGGDVVLKALKNISRGKVFDENFLMSIATIGAFIIGENAEAVGVMLFYQAGEHFQGKAVERSKKSIAELMDIRPDFANLKRDNDIIKVEPGAVAVGEVIIVKPGEKIPMDGVVISGESALDTVSLTGEAVPRKAAAGDIVLSGCVNLSGLLTISVTKTFGESTVSKIMELVENAADKKAATESFITKFARYYTPFVVGLALLIAITPPLALNASWAEWINRALILLVISCPCALVMSIPLSFFAGLGRASKSGILIKGGNYLEALNDLDIVVFDKTGTLTKGVFKVTELHPANGFSSEALLELAAGAEAFSNHPIALSIAKEYGRIVNRERLSDYSEISGYGVSVKQDGRPVAAGNKKLMEKLNIAFEETKSTGTKVYVALNNVFAGCVVISDELKPDSRAAVAALKKRGVRKIAMLSGDDPQIAGTIGRELELDEVYGGLLPHEKAEKLETLKSEKRANGKIAFAGDGINDAPVLAMADIGVAMGGLGSDAAIEAADIILMNDEPSKLVQAVDIARFTKRIVWQNIVFALGVKGIFILLGAAGIAGMWEAVFADVGVALLAVLNAARIIKS